MSGQSKDSRGQTESRPDRLALTTSMKSAPLDGSADGEQTPLLTDSTGIQSMEAPGDRPGGISDFEAFLHIVKGNIGTGLLGLPFAFHYAGFAVGIVSMIFVAVVATTCMQMLVRCSHRLCQINGLDTLDYAGVGEYAVRFRFPSQTLPKISRFVVNLFLSLTQIGFCCVYYLFVAQNLEAVLLSCRLEVSLLLLVAILLPLFVLCAMIRNLKTLAVFSGIANVLQVICIVIIIVNIGHIGFRKWGLVRMYPEKATDIALFFGLSMFSLEGIGVILPLENDVAQPSHFRRVIYTSMSFVSFNYIFMGAIGYAAYGPDILGSITLNLPTTTHAADIPYIFAKLFYSTSIFLSYFLQFYVATDILEPNVLKCVHGDRWKMLGSSVFRTALVIFSGAMAVGVPKIGLVIALVGAFGSSMLAMSFPPMLYNLVFWDDMSSIVIVRNCILSCIGVIGMFVGTYATIVEMVAAFNPTASPPTVTPTASAFF